jgi:SAM-dependent methyltransferase
LSGKVLDIGCNDGTVIQSLFRLPQTSTRFLGIDIVHHRLVDARKNGLAAAQADAASSLPFADSSIDFILSNQVIEHVASVDLFMAEIVRILSGYRDLVQLI